VSEVLTALVQVIGSREVPRIRRFLLAAMGYGVLQGIVFVLLAPVLRALFAGDVDGAVGWLPALGAATVACVVTYYVQALLGFTTAVASTGALYRRLGDHLGALGIGWFSSIRLGSLTRLATNGVGEITVVFAHLLGPLVTAIVTPLTVLVAMVFLDWRIAVAMLVTVPLLYGCYRWTTAVIARTDRRVDAAIGEANDRVLEFARLQPELRAFGRTREQNVWLADAIAGQHEAGRRQLRTNSIARGMFGLAVQLSVTLVIVVAVWLALAGVVDLALLIAIAVLVVRFSEPIVALGDLGGSLRTVRNRLDQMREILLAPPLPEPRNPRSPADGRVDLDDVVFGYPGASDGPVIRGLRATIPANRMTALVGPSGSGKTTLTKLIARFFDVEGGAVRIGGVDVRDMSSADITAAVAMVFQDVYLFEGSIEDNIRLGRPDASHEELVDAARLARVDEIVERLPNGWRTEVGEGGAALSGGERQRISLARALVKQAPVLVLDEATAALDTVNEQAVSETLRALSGACTLLVIAHRLPTVVAADQILVLDKGTLSESGTHEELLDAGGLYRRFWDERERVGGWRLRSTP
jgi:ATP-binding cassette, subfamily B, bacterial IrtB/YbtQ